ncbi:DUF1776-domain-containing protein [Xylariaceae sp. FL1019]|nr:DUF1776-domain-containing protein [Xylariaceae sp. FL1019]
MSADDQQFWDLLSSLPTHIHQYSGNVAEYVDKAVDQAASSVRDALAASPWLPDMARPRATPKPPPVQIVPLSTWERMQDWVVRHKILTGVIVCAFGYTTYRVVRQSRLLRKSRRAKRAKNGGRLEVVVIAGSPSLPLTRLLALDLERKGFIVYIVCNTIDDELLVQNLSRPDIKGLSIDITDPPSAGASIERFAQYLQIPHAAVPRAKPTYLALTSVILIPSLHYETSPIATIPPSNFANLFNTHLLHPILTIQSFLPLLTSRLTPAPVPHSTTTETTPTKAPKVLVFTPSIISSINPPFHAPEATVCSALSAFTEVLTAELHPLGIPVTHLQLGTFDFTGFQRPFPIPSAETAQWPEPARLAYARNYESQSISAIAAGRIRGLKGSSLRDLHNAVFDVIDGSQTSSLIRVGLGAGLYGFVGRWAPRGVVAWMMGIRKVDQLSLYSWEGSFQGSSSEKSGSESGEIVDVSEDGSEHIGNDSGLNVWKDD